MENGDFDNDSFQRALRVAVDAHLSPFLSGPQYKHWRGARQQFDCAISLVVISTNWFSTDNYKATRHASSSMRFSTMVALHQDVSPTMLGRRTETSF
ncbi:MULTISPECIES: hypothetical protein [Polaromonas]|uniref:Uncharacterized protein n=1 Tax=Polaromonas aquatica TaxID=332657 RepID=A0ABW1U6M5_9BURK